MKARPHFFQTQVNNISVRVYIEQDKYTQYQDDIAPTIVDRAGLMTATDIIDVIPPCGDFKLTQPPQEHVMGQLTANCVPKTVEFTATWYHADEKLAYTAEDANTFGRSGVLEIHDQSPVLQIPKMDAGVISCEELAKFGARLVPVHERIKAFNTSSYPLPVVTYRVHHDYVHKYLFQPHGGGGAFLEHHIPPHIWIPLHPACSGALILGRKESEEQFKLTAVTIPYGYALALDAHALHADSFLIGDYAMALSATKDKAAKASTVIFRRPTEEMLPVEIVAAQEIDETNGSAVQTKLLSRRK